MSVQSRLRRRRVRAAVVLVAAAGVAAAVLILAGAVALAASAWFPAGAFGGAASAGQRVLTPEILEWRHLDHGELGSTWLLADDDVGGPDWRPGVAVTCSAGVLAMWAFFGPYPADGSPVQFAVRTVDGRVERHGPVTRGASGAGFHDPMVPLRGDILRMIDAAAATGSLLSNVVPHPRLRLRPVCSSGTAPGAPEAGRRRPAENARGSPRDRFRRRVRVVPNMPTVVSTTRRRTGRATSRKDAWGTRALPARLDPAARSSCTSSWSTTCPGHFDSHARTPRRARAWW